MKVTVIPRLVFLAHYLQTNCLASNDACKGCRILTPAIKTGNASEARLNARVQSDTFLGLASYSGFITVKEEYDSNLFFWFFPGLNKEPLGSTPWIIWLQGGPGYSSLFGLFKLVGPMKIENGQVLFRNTTLAQNYPVLFIDNPVGAGYSNTANEQAYPDNVDDIGAQLLEFLNQFLEMFPELRSAPLFLAGESYAGKYIPAFGIHIHSHNIKATQQIQAQFHVGSGGTGSGSLFPSPEKQAINLRGLIIGGGMINPGLMMEYSQLVSSLGLLDEVQTDHLQEIERAAVRYLKEKRMVDAAYKFNETIEFIKKHSSVSVYNFIQDPTPNNVAPEFEAFIQRPDIRVLIGAGTAKFDFNNQIVYEKMLPDIMNTTQPFVEELLNYYPVLCYHGQQDIIMAYSLALNTYKGLRWNRWSEYQLNATRSFLKDADGHTLAYIKSGGGFTDMLIRHAGHMVPGDVPELATYIHYDFIEKNKSP